MLHISDENNKLYFVEPHTECIRMMGFNIGTSFCSDNQNDSIYHSRFRNNYLKQLIESLQLSFCVLCEVSPSQGLFLQQNFPTFELICYFSETSNDLTKTLALIDSDKDHIKNVGEGICVMIDKRFKVIDKRVIELPKGKRHSRIAVSVTLQMKFTKLTIICTHLDHLSRESRVASLEKIGQYTKSLTHPFVIYGDLNLFPDNNGEKDYLEFLSNNRDYLSDVTLKNHYGSFGTFCSYKCNQFAPPIKYNDEQKRHIIPKSNRLDIMFASHQVNIHFTHCPIRVFDPSDHKILLPTDDKFDENFEKRHFISDHLPIIAQFDFCFSKI
jgi:endonuclease/exonuclease/phosphatase family metal-dependent hydrolase